jgi:hypothetical protein
MATQAWPWHPTKEVTDRTMAMAERKPFLLRMDPAVLESLQRWADEELRSLNGQIEFLLRRALEERKRMKPRDVVERQGEG